MLETNAQYFIVKDSRNPNINIIVYINRQSAWICTKLHRSIPSFEITTELLTSNFSNPFQPSAIQTYHIQQENL
jgi:hypothetical protein